MKSVAPVHARSRSGTRLLPRGLGGVLVCVPLVLALCGPFVAPQLGAHVPLDTSSTAHPLGTDYLGRDVVALVLAGGSSLVLLTGLSLVLAYVVGVPLGLLIANQHGRWSEKLVLRGLDVTLALPGLLVLMMLAAVEWRGEVTLTCATAVLQLPAVVRLVRSAALEPGCRTAVEALYLQGESWWRVHLGYIGRSVLGAVLVDAGNRLSLVLYLIASANFLGIGLSPDSPDWAVVIERNKEAMFVQPWAVLVPAALLVALCTGANLLIDQFTRKSARAVGPPALGSN